MYPSPPVSNAYIPHGGILMSCRGNHQQHDNHAGHDPAMFRRRFWISLLLTIPLVVTSDMVMGWFNYSIDFPGMSWLGPVLGSAVFCGAAGRS